jgi:structural maintenance of chromosomes protein 5
MSYSCLPFPADLDVSGIEDLRLQKEDHVTNIEGMREAIKTLHRKQRQLEDEEANIHRQKV